MAHLLLARKAMHPALSGFGKADLPLDHQRSLVEGKNAGGNRRLVGDLEVPGDHGAERFGHETAVPEGLSEPIAYRGSGLGAMKAAMADYAFVSQVQAKAGLARRLVRPPGSQPCQRVGLGIGV